MSRRQEDREAWHTAIRGSQKVGHNLVKLNNNSEENQGKQSMIYRCTCLKYFENSRTIA